MERRFNSQDQKPQLVVVTDDYREGLALYYAQCIPFRELLHITLVQENQ